MGSSPTPSSPTAFFQTDTKSFKDLVQKLTGVDENSPEKLPLTPLARFSTRSPVPSNAVGPRRWAFKLQERRQNMMRKLEIKLGHTSIRNCPNNSPRSRTQTHLVDSTIPSPVTPLGTESLFSGSSSPAVSEEDKAIAEKGYYLHPLPLSSTPRGGGPLSDLPQLLTLFPLKSPKQKQPRDL
ncbi:hypothetical protein GIB67_014027 [Kingdonia uniflora]|uniref:VQ domain-containing protein n=1 Tax=Kingdonia uniflora TaxID=39325 RepID=A0A7J7L5Q6_9MAGN|nr:hypothetical protein GIB67_014027 [Kingdonia uniflora]